MSIRRRSAAGAALATLAVLAVAACSPGVPLDVQPGASGLPKDIKQVMEDPRYANSRWGLMTYDFTTDKPGLMLNEKQFFIPGSVTKLFSLSAAWNTFGPDHRFTTPVYRQGALSGGTVDGNLVLVASGDLTMGGRTKADGQTVDFANLDHADANVIPGATLTPEDPLAGLNQIAKQVKDSGVSHVSGDVVIDDRLFEVDREQNPEIPTTPIIINDNLIDMVSTPTAVGQPAKLDYRPQTSAYTVTSKVVTVAAGQPAQVQSEIVAPGQIELTGQVPMGISPPVLHVQQVEDPAAFARTALIDALTRAGVTVDAPATGGNPATKLPAKGSYAPGDQVAAFVSPVFSEYVKLILKVSLNLGANLSVCLLAVHAGSTDCLDGLPVEQAFLRDVAGVPVGELVFNDGQGASPADLVTPNAAISLLRWWQPRPDFARFRATLPILGRDGSLATVVPNSAAAGHVTAKTGTLAGGDELNQRLVIQAKALGGYIDTDNGKLQAFFLVMNNSPATSIDDVVTVNNDLGTIAARIWGPKG
ncbi:MAG TPA: D-alanyl-D-alanine carboxypeptidase/D-alanyl-D-alanine-endopeptidase [Lapillicoccus sp.]|nr:D-alanyl-D-alanine carboxypeptidase/D-alanyl-D-alanine-endopeptidase [Lapillicoccus sp.]